MPGQRQRTRSFQYEIVDHWPIAGGAAAGLIAADALKADDDWKLIAALGGAAAGTVVAQNSAAQSCAYARGDGTYYTAPCS